MHYITVEQHFNVIYVMFYLTILNLFFFKCGHWAYTVPRKEGKNILFNDRLNTVIWHQTFR